jgi:hypothetical protein
MTHVTHYLPGKSRKPDCRIVIPVDATDDFAVKSVTVKTISGNSTVEE